MQGKRKRTVSLLLLRKQPNKVSASKFRDPCNANGLGGILSLWNCQCFVGWRQHLSLTSESQPGSKAQGMLLVPRLPQVASTECSQGTSVLTSALPPRGGSASPLCTPQRRTPYLFCLASKNVKMQKFRVTLSEKCNFNDSSHAVYTYKWYKHGCWCTRKQRWIWKEILPPITCPFIGHTTRWAKNSGLP